MVVIKTVHILAPFFRSNSFFSSFAPYIYRNQIMSSEDSELNNSLVQSATRKKEYKQILEAGSHTAENVDNISVVDNFIALRDLLTKANDLIGQGNLTDRVGQSAEVVLDAQVNPSLNSLLGSYPSLKINVSIVIL